jgi:hypothetical protein
MRSKSQNLRSRDDIVLSNLKLSENMKLTMLAGHAPEVIIEIARFSYILTVVVQFHFGIIKLFKRT